MRCLNSTLRFRIQGSGVSMDDVDAEMEDEISEFIVEVPT